MRKESFIREVGVVGGRGEGGRGGEERATKAL